MIKLNCKIITIISFSVLYSIDSLGQKLVWAEEFNSAGLPDSKNWSYDVGDHGWGNNELQFYRRENTELKDGFLVITAKQESAGTRNYTSSRLKTQGKKVFQFGRIDIRAALPKGQGIWPAFWMLGTDIKTNPWPACGEIDIMEHVGFDPAVVHGTVHTGAFNHMQGTQKGKQIQVPTFHDEFHTYAIDWTEDRIDFYLDGEKYFTFENSGGDYMEWPFDQSFHLILNIAVGGGWGGQKGVDPEIWPQRMEVDFIRVFDQKPF